MLYCIYFLRSYSQKFQHHFHQYNLDFPEDFFVIKNIINKLGFYCDYKKISKFLIKNKKISNFNKKYIGTMWYQKNF